MISWCMVVEVVDMPITSPLVFEPLIHWEKLKVLVKKIREKKKLNEPYDEELEELLSYLEERIRLREEMYHA